MDSRDLTSLTFGIFGHNGFEKVNVRASVLFKTISAEHAAAPHAHLENGQHMFECCCAAHMPLAFHRPCELEIYSRSQITD